jgi:uncharacterized protein
MPRREEKKKEMHGKMTREEAGKKGGEATKGTHGRESYQEMGKRGGEKHAREMREENVSPENQERLSEAGKKGGETTKGTHGSVEVRVPKSSLESGQESEETPGQESYQEMGKKGGVAPKGVAKGEAAEKGEVTVRLSGKELEIKFSSQEEAEGWRNRFEQVMKQEGYRLTQKKPGAVGSEAEAAAGE